jgi:Ca2+-binding RTX toxin-like protein
MATFTGTVFDETITPTFVSATVVRDPPGALPGSPGGDFLRGGGGNDKLTGGAFNDKLDGGTGADTMTGGAGADTYFVDNRGDQVIEAPSLIADTVNSTITYTLPVNVENLFLVGSQPIDGTGNSAKNTIVGNVSDNVINGLGDNDILSGAGGKDTLLGGAGNDHLDGGTGDDKLDGGTGNDMLIGSVGLDTLIGGAGDDVLDGGTGNDTLDGGAGNDTLTGGVGTDVITGGLGLDRFDFNFTTESAPGFGTSDIITDFTGNGTVAGDVIDLLTVDADVNTPGNQAFHFIGSAQFSATNATGELRYANGTLQGSTNVGAAPELEIRLTANPVLFVGGAGSDIIL